MTLLWQQVSSIYMRAVETIQFGNGKTKQSQQHTRLRLSLPPSTCKSNHAQILQTDQITLDSSAQGGACSVGMGKQSSSDKTQNIILGIGLTLLEVQYLGTSCRYSMLVPSNMALGAP